MRVTSACRVTSAFRNWSNQARNCTSSGFLTFASNAAPTMTFCAVSRLRYAGYGVAVNHDADSHISPAPELMEFHLKTREAPLFAAVNTPEKQPDHLFRSLGFNRTWDEWRREEDARTHATERRHDRGWSQ